MRWTRRWARRDERARRPAGGPLPTARRRGLGRLDGGGTTTAPGGGVPDMTGGVVAAVESLAAEVGGEVLRAGGNAADAAVATAFAQGVVDPIYCGIGGTLVGLFYDAATGRARIVAGGGRAPRRARAGMWRITGQWGAMWMVEGDRNRLGYQASTVPGFVRGAAEAFQRFGSGRVSWGRIIEPSIALAEEGFSVYPYLYRLWMPSTDRMRGFIETGDGPRILSTTDECRRIYLHDDGSVYGIGERLVQKDYARTLRRIARNGPDEFYEGETARLMADDFQRNGGLLDAEDLRSCRAEVSEPAMTTFRGYQVLTDRPPAVGVVTLEVLNILEGLDLAALGWNTPEYLDLLARAMHLGFRDRMTRLGDPDFVEVPLEMLLSKAYAEGLRRQVQAGGERGAAAQSPGHAPPSETTHVTVVDGDGNGAAITHSIGMSSGVVTPGLGFQHNCHMIMFDPVGGSRNEIAPGKRPISGGGPVLFMRDGGIALLIGSPAGARKVTGIIQAFLNGDTFGMTLPEAVAAERIHVENEPGMIFVEPHFDPRVLIGLARLGHRIRFESYTARLAGVARRADGALVGASDPRGDRGLVVVP
jgi:gamma-glutamyltranspeptidase/glutathione hydrolase